MAVWLGEDVAKYVKGQPIKINPNGVDIKISEIWRIPENAEVLVHGQNRIISPPKIKVEPKDGFWELKRGIYEIRLANEITIPPEATGLTFPRSTFNRLGIIKAESAVWDSGYRGFGTQTIFVAVKTAKIHVDEAWVQLIFIDNKERAKMLYNGHWQGEK
ncbi:MAG: dCTP deaminase domain-containing protein [Candidatus Nanoarchaeia archaeon]